MLHDNPAWTATARGRITHGYGRVTLMSGHALGQWVCLERRSGRVLWEHDFERPNSVKGVAGGIVIATENRPVGLMGWSDFDCYALELDTGRLVWTTHPSGGCGRPSTERYM
jgi:outer membrane protein assembly factor BamB